MNDQIPRGNTSTDGKVHKLKEVFFKEQQGNREKDGELTYLGNVLNNSVGIEDNVEEITIHDFVANFCGESELLAGEQRKANVCLKTVWSENVSPDHDKLKSFEVENMSGNEDLNVKTAEEFTNRQQQQNSFSNDKLVDTKRITSQLEEGRSALLTKLENLEKRLHKGKKTKDKLARDKQYIEQIRAKIKKLDERIANEREKETTKLFQQRLSSRPKTARKASANTSGRNSRSDNNKMTLVLNQNSDFRGEETQALRQTSAKGESVSSRLDRKSSTGGDKRTNSRATARSSSAFSVPDKEEEDGYSLPMAWIANKETRNEPCVGTEAVRQGLEDRGQTPLPVEIYSELLSEKDKKSVAKSAHYLPPIAVQKNFWDKEIFEDPPMIREDEKMRISYFPNRRRLLLGRARVYLKQEEFVKFHNLRDVIKKDTTDSTVVQAARELLLEEKRRKPKSLPVHFM